MLLAVCIFTLTQGNSGVDFASLGRILLSAPVLIRLSRPLGLPARCTRGGSYEIQKIDIDHEDDSFRRICNTASIDRTTHSIHCHRPRHTRWDVERGWW